MRAAAVARAGKLGRFLVAGLPSFLVAIPANVFLVERVRLSPAVAYAAVLAFQVGVNFLLCRWFVFERRAGDRVLRQLRDFVGGIAVFRVADWIVFAVLVELLSFHYVAVQLSNVALFGILKFVFAEWIFERREDGTS